MNALPALLVLLVATAGCTRSTEDNFNGDALAIDDRYVQAIEFKMLGIRVPLGQNAFVRMDAPVTDTQEHLQTVLRELRVNPKRIDSSNPATNGMQMHLRFRDGKQCSFVWVRQDTDPRIVKARINHEKYHALCRLKPGAVADASAGISGLGFNVNLADYDEELAATVIEMLTLYREGIPLEQIRGSQMVVKAVDLLGTAQIDPNATGLANGSRTVRTTTNSTPSSAGPPR